ncbi:MAG: hypothetical protein WCD70_10470 [Alphaproteobacteria bacterium]
MRVTSKAILILTVFAVALIATSAAKADSTSEYYGNYTAPGGDPASSSKAQSNGSYVPYYYHHKVTKDATPPAPGAAPLEAPDSHQFGNYQVPGGAAPVTQDAVPK